MNKRKVMFQFIFIPLFFILLFSCRGNNGRTAESVKNDPSQGGNGMSNKTVKLSEGIPANPFCIKTEAGPVYSIDISEGSQTLAIADYRRVSLFDSQSGEFLSILNGHSNYVWGVSWSPDSKFLASASQDGTVCLWDMASNSLKEKIKTGWAFCVDWSADGKYLMIGTYAGQIRVWNRETDQVFISEKTEYSPIISIGLSPDNKAVAVGRLNGTIEIWEVGKNFELQLKKSLNGYTLSRCDVNGLSWAPDGSVFATANQDGKIRIWNPLSGEMINSYTSNYGWSRGIAFSSDGKTIASGGEDGYLTLWDLKEGNKIDRYSFGKPIWSIIWTEEGKRIIFGTGIYEQPNTGECKGFNLSV